MSHSYRIPNFDDIVQQVESLKSLPAKLHYLEQILWEFEEGISPALENEDQWYEFTSDSISVGYPGGVDPEAKTQFEYNVSRFRSRLQRLIRKLDRELSRQSLHVPPESISPTPSDNTQNIEQVKDQRRPFLWTGSPEQREVFFKQLMEVHWIPDLSKDELEQVYQTCFVRNIDSALQKLEELRSKGTRSTISWQKKQSALIYLIKCLIAQKLLPIASDTEVATLIYENFQKWSQPLKLNSLKTQATKDIPDPGKNPHWHPPYRQTVEDLVAKVKAANS